MDVPVEAARPVSLHFNSTDQQGETDISVTAMMSCYGDQITRPTYGIALSIVWASSTLLSYYLTSLRLIYTVYAYNFMHQYTYTGVVEPIYNLSDFFKNLILYIFIHVLLFELFPDPIFKFVWLFSPQPYFVSRVKGTRYPNFDVQYSGHRHILAKLVNSPRGVCTTWLSVICHHR